MEPVEGLGLTILILALKHTYQLCGIGQFRTLAHNHISPRQWQPYEQLFRCPYWGSSEWHSRRVYEPTNLCVKFFTADVCTSLNASCTVHKLLVGTAKQFGLTMFSQRLVQFSRLRRLEYNTSTKYITCCQ